MAKRVEWNGMLRDNPFTSSDIKDQLLDVVSKGTIRDEDIIAALKKDGMEFAEESVADIILRYRKKSAEFAHEGYCITNELFQITPKVTGVFENINSTFDPNVHKCAFTITAGSALQAAAQNVSVKIVGVKESGGAKIGCVTDSLTGIKNELVTIGDDVIIEGAKIRIQDEADPLQGVFFIGEDGVEHRVVRRFMTNNPGTVVARVPQDVTEGNVRLVIRTKFSSGNKVLANLREIAYAYPLKATKASS